MRLMFGCVLAVAVSCTCQPPLLPGPSIEFTARGDGEENVLPLWPLEPGYRSAQGFVEVATESPYGHGVLYRLAAPDGLITQLYLKTPEGIFFAGGTDVGALDRPILQIPSRVKVGMRWVSKGSTGRPDTVALVKARTVSDTKFGKQPVWSIEAIDQGTKEVFTYSWVEGFGEASATTVFFDAMAVAPPARKLVTLEPIKSEVIVGWSMNPSMVRLPDGRAWVVGGNPGSRGLCHWFNSDGIVKEPELATGDGPYARVR